jgi:hypothetical protein
MKKQPEARVLSNENGAGMARMQEEMCAMENSGKQQLQDITRLRIERNRLARHVRCATVRMK